MIRLSVEGTRALTHPAQTPSQSTGQVETVVTIREIHMYQLIPLHTEEFHILFLYIEEFLILILQTEERLILILQTEERLILILQTEERLILILQTEERLILILQTEERHILILLSPIIDQNLTQELLTLPDATKTFHYAESNTKNLINTQTSQFQKNHHRLIRLGKLREI